MDHEETLRAAELLAASSVGKWIDSRLIGGVLTQRCTRCGAEALLELPTGTPSTVPPDFDDKLFHWKRDFQLAHADCTETSIDQAFDDGGAT